MSEKPFTIIVLALLAIAVTLYLRSETVPQHQTQGNVSDDYGPAPDIPLPIGPDHKKVDLSSLRGNVVVLDFWATWCGPCKMSIPELQDIWSKHKNEPLKVIGISVDEPTTRKEVEPTVAALGMTYPIAIADDIPDLRNKYTFASIPMLIIIDKKGIIRSRTPGYDPSAHNEATIAALLKEKYP